MNANNFIIFRNISVLDTCDTTNTIETKIKKAGK